MSDSSASDVCIQAQLSALLLFLASRTEAPGSADVGAFVVDQTRAPAVVGTLPLVNVRPICAVDVVALAAMEYIDALTVIGAGKASISDHDLGVPIHVPWCGSLWH